MGGGGGWVSKKALETTDQSPTSLTLYRARGVSRVMIRYPVINMPYLEPFKARSCIRVLIVSRGWLCFGGVC